MKFDDLPNDIIDKIYNIKYMLEWKCVTKEIQRKKFRRHMLKVNKRFILSKLHLSILRHFAHNVPIRVV